MKVHEVFSPNVGGVVVDQSTFQIFVMSIRSGDICNKSRKLSEIAPHFVRFCPPKSITDQKALKDDITQEYVTVW